MDEGQGRQLPVVIALRENTLILQEIMSCTTLARHFEQPHAIALFQKLAGQFEIGFRRIVGVGQDHDLGARIDRRRSDAVPRLGHALGTIAAPNEALRRKVLRRKPGGNLAVEEGASRLHILGGLLDF
jgi:hypothetical protein